MEHDFLEIIKTRRSCRKFQDRQISHVELDAVLEAGTYAPSAGGRQSAFIVAVQNKEQRKKLAACGSNWIQIKSFLRCSHLCIGFCSLKCSYCYRGWNLCA